MNDCCASARITGTSTGSALLSVAAAVLNVTVAGATQDTRVIAHPGPAKRTTTSKLSPEPGVDKSNRAIVPVGPDGTVTLYDHSGATDLILDAVGSYAQQGKGLFTPVAPTAPPARRPAASTPGPVSSSPTASPRPSPEAVPRSGTAGAAATTSSPTSSATSPRTDGPT
ncbi:hypothetical protein [Streptomyces sp. NPDC090021]|uniref:hypothetical protein n=1 Tax=Streptomyces sp. NPDC090021 TaxID=3365919 RepID=UPI00381849A1